MTPPLIARRTLLGGALAAQAFGSACSGAKNACGAPTAANPATVAALREQKPFYVAHRGGGGNWPEMTLYAYQQAAKVPGLKALEVSVCLSSDAVLVCSHDPDTKRVSGMDYTIADTPWSTLSTVMVSAAQTTDPSQPARPLSRFDEVAAQFQNAFVLFVEPKVDAAAQPLMAAVTAANQPERVVWKQYINSSLFDTAKQRGFTTWGYVLNEPAHTGANLTRYAAKPSIDMLGAPLSESDDFIKAVVAAANANGKPTIAWPIAGQADRERAYGLGCVGLMTSTIAQVHDQSC
jgi:glycerophosphoryl diester phosphodiesterase